jgi:mRNA interferase RelE/StbE
VALVWTIEFGRNADKQLARLAKRDAARIISFLEERLVGHENPRELGAALQGDKLRQYWRYRVGDFRIVCDIQDNRLVILVIEVGHRREIYR